MNINMNPLAVWSCHCVGYAIRKGSDREQKHFNSQMEVINDIMLKNIQVHTKGIQHRGDIYEIFYIIITNLTIEILRVTVMFFIPILKTPKTHKKCKMDTAGCW